MNLPYYNVTMFKLLVTSLFLFTALNPFLLLLLCYTFARRCLSLRGLAPTEAVVIRSEAERPREQGPVGPSDRVAGSRTRTWEQSQLPGARPPCFEVEKHASRLVVVYYYSTYYKVAHVGSETLLETRKNIPSGSGFTNWGGFVDIWGLQKYHGFEQFGTMG
jgi:hypothetical protein